jgi:PAS domain S-box-containing protein
MESINDVPNEDNGLETYMLTSGQGLILRARDSRTPVLSAPKELSPGVRALYAVFPLELNGDLLGFLAVQFSTRALLDDCFHERIRSEFDIVVKDGPATVFSHNLGETRSLLKASRCFSVMDRNWCLSVAPHPTSTANNGHISRLSVPMLGLVLSVGMGLLVHLLLLRIAAYRVAHNQALNEIAERQASEARYFSVFNSATDGLVVLDAEGYVGEANAAADAMYGHPQGHLVGMASRLLVRDEHRPRFDIFFEQVLHHSKRRIDVVGVRSDGSAMDVEIRGTSFTSGGHAAVMMILTDVSERRQAMRKQALLSQKVLMAQEEERKRLSRELHDDLGQLLTAIRLDLDFLCPKLPADQKQGFVRTTGLVEVAADQLRRICRGLRPPLLDDLGLEPALRQLIQQFQTQTPIQIDLEMSFDEEHTPVSSAVALCVYRVLQEALTNVGRHGNARKVEISLVGQQDALVLSVYDDGQGFDLSEVRNLHGVGIEGMRERASLIEASLEIQSVIGEGTRLTLHVPLAHQRKEES